MPEIYHLLAIKADAATVYAAVTTQDGLSNWWLPDTIAKPEIGFINEFRVGTRLINKMRVIALETNGLAEWECINDNDEWTGTHIIFAIEEKEDASYLHFKQKYWREQTVFFGNCSFHWARHLIMLKHYCETGASILQADSERQLADSALKNL